MPNSLSIAAGVIDITSTALYEIRLLLVDLQNLKDTPKTIKCLLEDLRSVEAALAALKAVDNRDWENLGEIIAEGSKTIISICIKACEQLRIDLERWTKHFQDGRLGELWDQAHVGFFENSHISEQLQNCKNSINYTVGTANLYSSIRNTHMTEEIRKTISMKQTEIKGAITSADKQLIVLKEEENIESKPQALQQVEEERSAVELLRKLLDELLVKSQEEAVAKAAAENKSCSTTVALGNDHSGFHDQVVETLLDKGANVNAQDRYYRNALQTASYRGRDKVVQMLLDKGADVKAQGGFHGNAQDRDYDNALHAASSGGHDQVVQMLLDKGADVNAQGGFHGNALQAASYGGYEKVVTMLRPIIKQQEMSMIFRKTFMQGNTFHATRNLDKKSRFVYHCFWELPNTMRTQFQSGQRLSRVITLTGSTDNAEAATCEDFISQSWPTSGSLLLKAIEDFLISLESSTEKDKHERSSRLSEGSTNIEIRSVIKSGKDVATEGVIETRITVDTSLRNQYDIAGSLAWLAATIRTSKNEALTKSKVQFVFQDLLSNEADASYRLILEPLEDSDEAPVMCWHPLFVNAVLAVQFPIAERTHGYGIELSPFLMARLAGIIMPVGFLGGYILKGLSTALIPMEEFEGDGAIQWHLLLTESTEDVIKVKDDFFKVKDVQTLMKRKAYLGWCKVAKVLLGTAESDTVDVGWSDPSPKQQRIALSGFSLGVASSGMGIFGPSASANFTLASNCRTRFMDTKQPLQNRLKLSVVRPVLLYDTSEKRAWLVPTVCILLQMMHLRSRELSKHHKPSTEEGIPDMPRAKIGRDSADEAYKVLTHFLEDDTATSLGSSEIWTETLARFYICLDMALNESINIKETSSSRDTNIFGFELMDIVLSESPFRFTGRKVGRESGGWANLARDVGYVLFCSRLGNAIMPGPSGDELCQNWSSLPSNFDYLAAYIPSLIDVLRRQGWHNVIQRLQNTTSGSMLYSDCNHSESSRCSQHLQQYKNLQNGEERSSDGVNSSHPQRALSKENIGAVVFGKITRLQKPYPENLQKVSDRQPDITSRNLFGDSVETGSGELYI